jgi:hypothetical protein
MAKIVPALSVALLNKILVSSKGIKNASTNVMIKKTLGLRNSKGKRRSINDNIINKNFLTKDAPSKSLPTAIR